MSILEVMEQKKRELEKKQTLQEEIKKEAVPIPHAMVEEDIAIRFSYMVGIALLASVDSQSDEKKEKWVQELGHCLEISEEQLQQIIRMAATANEETLDSIIEALCEKRHQIAFVLDLYRTGWQDVGVNEVSIKMINLFSGFFELDMRTREFLHDVAKVALTNNPEYAKEIIEKEKTLGIDIYANEIMSTDWRMILGLCYYYGIEMEKDYETAVGFFNKLAMSGYASAQRRLASCYFNGHGVEQNYDEAIRLYQMAANQGEAMAQRELGSCYFNGYGVNGNYDEAIRWYQMAANQGDEVSQRELNYIENEMEFDSDYWYQFLHEYIPSGKRYFTYATIGNRVFYIEEHEESGSSTRTTSLKSRLFNGFYEQVLIEDLGRIWDSHYRPEMYSNDNFLGVCFDNYDNYNRELIIYDIHQKKTYKICDCEHVINFGNNYILYGNKRYDYPTDSRNWCVQGRSVTLNSYSFLENKTVEIDQNVYVAIPEFGEYGESFGNYDGVIYYPAYRLTPETFSADFIIKSIDIKRPVKSIVVKELGNIKYVNTVKFNSQKGELLFEMLKMSNETATYFVARRKDMA